ncbi:sialidase family protein [Tellurirhabdus bombi]|uniref:sialidase family protein n=1 Tax=Tellurirhabdus bombi TaxID=2907205 RepID=UPI001F41DB5D|nr:sialidase family protein [Tellurirhabdus bombi]
MKTLLNLLIVLLGTYQAIAADGQPVKIGANSSLPRFTTDHKGNPVLSWVEKKGDEIALYYSVSTDAGKTFGQKNRVLVPANTATHAEGMPKIAFKADGTVFALIEVRRPTEDAPRAGDVLFTTSSDNGKTWSATKPVHRDASPGKGHSFADIAQLPNGEIGIIWLDDKLASFDGRPVKFVQTLPGGGFSPEMVVDSNACQCCRTSITADQEGRIHLAWRDLLADGARDMSYAVSADGGKSFTAPRTILRDNWKINACPHSGIQLVPSKKALLATWYSGVDKKAGIRLMNLTENKLIENLSVAAMKHPQLSVLPNNKLALIWDEFVGEGPEAYQKIGLRVYDGSGNAKTSYLTPNGKTATLPAILTTNQGLVVAYEQHDDTNSQVVVTTVGL